MAAVTWGDRVREVSSRRLGTVWAVEVGRLLVVWDEPLPQAVAAASFVDRHAVEVLPSYVRAVSGRLRRGYGYHLWRAKYGAPLDYWAALQEEVEVLIEEFYGH